MWYWNLVVCFSKYELDYLGIDSDYTDRDLLCIDESNFKCFDLNNLLVLDRRYDLAKHKMNWKKEKLRWLTMVGVFPFENYEAGFN